jgi:peroxiredoxin
MSGLKQPVSNRELFHQSSTSQFLTVHEIADSMARRVSFSWVSGFWEIEMFIIKELNYSILAVALLLVTSTAWAEVYPDARQVQPLLPGSEIPAFKLLDMSGETIAVDPDALEKPIVLTFYRGGWCPYCNLHLAELRHAEERLRKLGFAVWFVSPDRPELLAEGGDAAQGYQLLSDPDASATEAFGVAFRLDDETHAQYKNFGVDIDTRSGVANQVLPVASTFLIGKDGIVQFAYANPDYTVRLSPEVLVAAAEAYIEQSHRRLQRARQTN